MKQLCASLVLFQNFSGTEDLVQALPSRSSKEDDHFSEEMLIW